MWLATRPTKPGRLAASAKNDNSLFCDRVADDAAEEFALQNRIDRFQSGVRRGEHLIGEVFES